MCKNWLQIPNRLGKSVRKLQGGGFFWLTLYINVKCVVTIWVESKSSCSFQRGTGDGAGLPRYNEGPVLSMLCNVQCIWQTQLVMLYE